MEHTNEKEMQVMYKEVYNKKLQIDKLKKGKHIHLDNIKQGDDESHTQRRN